jgi:carboxypeptidase family protein
VRRILLLLVLSLATHFAMGQTGNAELSGEVSDPSGAVIPGTIVTLSNALTGLNLTSKTGAEGYFHFPAVQPGTYSLKAEHAGFKVTQTEEMDIHTADRLEMNLKLQVGSTSQAVTVSATASNDSPGVSLTVTREFVENMPLNGRSFQDLIQLAPGAVSSQNGYYSIDGQRTSSNNYTMDGVSANLGGVNRGTDQLEAIA